MEDNKEYKNNKCLKFFLFFFNLLLFLNGLVLLILSVVILKKTKFQDIIIIHITISVVLLINSCIGFFFNSKNKMNLLFNSISFIFTLILSILLFINIDLDLIDNEYEKEYTNKKLYYKIILLLSCFECLMLIIFYKLYNKKYYTENGPSLLKNIIIFLIY
jgi:Na+/H+-translocating membrane pyrophosphatase